MSNPTIVSAALSDKELQDSINRMVANFDKGLKDMLDHTNEYVGKIQESLQKIGSTNFGAKGSNDGAVVKQTKAQNDFTDAVKKSTNEIKRQGKEGEMSFDQIAAALDKARRTVSDFNTKRASGILPSSEDYKRYEQALARIVEYNDKLKQSALGKAFANEQSFAFDANRNIKDMFAVDERLKQLNKYYAEQEKMTAKRQALVDKEVAAYNDAMRKKEQSLASYTEKERASIEKYQDKVLKTAWRDALRMPTENIDQATAKIERIKSLISTLHPIGIISKADVDVANATISKLEKRFGIQSAVNSELKKESAFTNQSRQSIEALNAAVAQNTRRETERQRAMIESGVAAQNAFAKIRQSVQEQIAVNTDKPIQGIQELTEAIKNMNRLYWGVSVESRESPLGQALKRDIENAQKLKIAIDAYNRTLTGMSVLSTKNNVGSNLGAYTELTNILKTLSDEYKRLGREERNAAKGNDLADKIQRLSRATQKIQQQMNRPISFAAAMKGDEKTLDDIAYKMQRLRSYRQGIDLTKPNAANEIRQVDEALAKLQKDADKWMSKSQEMIKSNTALGRSWNYMKNRLAFYFTVGASTQFIKNLIEVRSQYEMNERALGILIDSAERGTQIFNELSQMALVSPYTLIELSTAAKQLTAYDVAAKDVVDTTRRLADMAAAVGIPIERLTYALGQIKAYGYLNSRDARMFANAGIPLVKQLSDYYTELEGRLVSTADVYDRIKKKAIDYNEVMEVINKMTDQGGKFFDFQAKMADTLKVRLANLTLAWNNMLNDMGKESQGVLTWGIGALRDLFLQWKQLDNLIKNAALAVGVRTLLVALRAATIGLSSFGKAMTWNAILGQKLGGVVVGLAKSFGTLFSSRLTWFALLAMAAVEATQALFGVNEAQKALNESIRNGAKDNYDNISKFLEQYKEVRDSLYKNEEKPIFINATNLLTGKQVRSQINTQTVTTPNDIDENEAKKAWEAVREQIELTVASSDKYIGNLLSISNMSERVRQGFNLLDDVQVVNAALKELDNDTIKVSKDLSAWWNAWQAPDGLIGNLKDYQETLNDIIAKYGTLESFRENTFLGGKGSDDLNDYQTALERFRDDLQKTTDSILNFIELKGWSGDEGKINQMFEQFTQKLVLDNQLDPQKAFTLQTEVEEARSKAAKQALLQRINDERAALKVSHDNNVREALAADIERYKNWDETNGRSKVEWERFTKWLKEQHISETTAMFRNMDAEDIKSLNFQEGKHAEWVTRMVTQYAKEHKMSYDEAFKYLRSWVRSANQWSIFIPLTISTEDKKSVYDQLGEYDKAIDEADAQIERLTKRIGELNAKKQKSKEETQELANAEQELADAQKAKADAEAKGGHGKKEKKDEKAANKAAKQAESELQKALKDELSTIDKVRSIYKDLTKEGMSHANAVERATRGWGETVNAINKVLQKNGLQKLDLSKFAGIENPRELLNILQSQLETLVKRGASTSEIRVLQTKIQTVSVEADKYDLTMITKGLNNELGKLKDEYELAVELDANPELGGIFADYMGINLKELPKNAEEAAKKAQQYIDKILRENNSSENINIASLMGKDAFDEWIKSSGHSMEDDLVKAVDNYRQALHKIQVDESKKQMQEWEKLLEKYAEYEYKVTQIQKDAEREREVARKKGASQEILDAINERERQESAKLSFEEFLKSPEWIVATGDLANMSNSAIGMLIEQLEKYKRSAKNLSPKQIKQLNSALSKLYKEQRKNNPFAAISNMLDETKERVENFNIAIADTKKELEELQRVQASNQNKGIIDPKTDAKIEKTNKRLAELIKKKNELDKPSASAWVESIRETIGTIEDAISLVDGLVKAISGVEESDLDKVFSVVSAAGQGAATGAKVGGTYGAIIGAVIGAGTKLSQILSNAYNENINKQIKYSEDNVKLLATAYNKLKRAIDEAYGADYLGSKKLQLANKQMELMEVQRQLQLERSRKNKNKDFDKITELEDRVDELQHEIKNAAKNIIIDLTGISDSEDWAERLVDNMIDAFKKGEDYMESYKDSFDDMIDSMIAKTIVGRLIGDRIEEMFKMIYNIAEQRAETDESVLNAKKEMDNMQAAYDLIIAFAHDTGTYVSDEVISGYQKALEEAQEKYAKAYANAARPTPEDVQSVRDMSEGWRDDVRKEFEEYMSLFGMEFGSEKAKKELSSLQQGIQGVSEETASAVEAYLNGMSQQAYLRNDLLTQIRDTIQSFDMDVQLGIFSQMLLQLQQSYQTQQAIQRILEGTLIPSGRAFAVEIVS